MLPWFFDYIVFRFIYLSASRVHWFSGIPWLFFLLWLYGTLFSSHDSVVSTSPSIHICHKVGRKSMTSFIFFCFMLFSFKGSLVLLYSLVLLCPGYIFPSSRSLILYSSSSWFQFRFYSVGPWLSSSGFLVVLWFPCTVVLLFCCSPMSCY